MPLEPGPIIEALRKLAQRDPQRRLFGANAHDYKLNPRLPPATVSAFEEEHGVALPPDYKGFLTSIGNGGAGPYYGLFRLGKDDTSEELPGSRSRLVGDLSAPFPHADAWNLPREFWEGAPDPPPDTPPEAEDELMATWDKVLEERYWNPAVMNGAIPICHRGCGLYQWLVVTGKQAGYVWNDERADEAGISPLRGPDGKQLTFADWYLQWLETAAAAPIERPIGSRSGLHGTTSLRDWTYLGAMVVGVIPGVAYARWNDWSLRGIQMAGLV
jgi:hypothetical protein